MWAFSYSTADTSTAAVPSSTLRARRSASVAAGGAATLTTVTPSSARRDASGRSGATARPLETGDSGARARSGSRTALRALSSQLRADRPEIGEGGLVQCRFEVFGARGSTGTGLRADGALHHLHVPVTPLHDPLIH